MSRKKNLISVVMIGDLVGRPGCALFAKWAPKLREKYAIDCLIVNGENSANNGRGITTPITKKLLEHADVITSGNHIWAQKGTPAVFATTDRLLRPMNFPADCPGQGHILIPVKDKLIAVVNMQGRIFMHQQVACPFRNFDSVLTYLKTQTNMILVDFHAETTSEKQGIGFYLDGKVSAVVGTHTHVQTADEQILPKGTAYITDLGCCGARHSMLGMNKDIILQNMMTQMPVRFAVEEDGPFALHGVHIMVDSETGKADSIERICIIDDELTIHGSNSRP